MTTVLVTGGAGFIATHTDIELLDKGYDVISVDNYGNSSPVALERGSGPRAHCFCNSFILIV